MKMMQEAMAEHKQSEQQTQPENVQEQKTEPLTNNVDDIIAKVSGFKKPEPKTSESQESADNDQFNANDIDKIQDPEARKYAEKAYKSFEKGYQKKYQELAKERKILESKMAEVDRWTPERVQSLISNQEFINAAKSVVPVNNPASDMMSDEEWSALGKDGQQEVMKMLQPLQNKLLQMEQQNKLMQIKGELEKQDAELKSKYSNYDPSKVHSLREDLITGKLNATSEHLWKVLDYEDAILRAVELGKTMAREDAQERSQATTIPSTRTVTRNDGVKPLEGESPKDFLMRRIRENLAKKK